MNHRFQLRHLLAATAALLASLTPAIAGTVGGSVTAINTLTETDHAAITIGSSTAGADNSQTDTTIVTGTIDNNSDRGWNLTITSANTGKLKKDSGGAGSEILYTSVKLFKTGGILGAGLTDPANGSTGVAKNIVTGNSDPGASAGTVIFNTGSAVGTHGTATTATQAYAYALKISWNNDQTLLAGTYNDTITLLLAND